MLWDKGAAWLIFFGLLFAVVPARDQSGSGLDHFPESATRADKLDFWLNLVAIVVAIDNAFVHSRDAYAVVPTGVLLLRVCTVILLSIGNIVIAVERASRGGFVNE